MALAQAAYNIKDCRSPDPSFFASPFSTNGRCTNCQLRDAATGLCTRWRACIHKCKFAPTRQPGPKGFTASIGIKAVNRFQALADLKQSPSQTDWAFDPAKQPGSARRRGKRGGKHNRLKLDARKRCEDRINTGLGGSCGKVTGMCLKEEPPKSPATSATKFIVPQSEFTFSHPLGSHWMPQLHPDGKQPSTRELRLSKLTSSKISFLMRSPDICLYKTDPAPPFGDIANNKGGEARILPLAAFLARPASPASQTGSNIHWPALTQHASTAKQLSTALATPAQKAAASAACQALSSRLARFAVTPGQPASSSAQTSSWALAHLSPSVSRPPILENPPTLAPPFPWLPITPSHVIPPTLSISPAMSNMASNSRSSRIVPGLTISHPEPSSPIRGQQSAPVRDTAQPWPFRVFYEGTTTPPQALITTPIITRSPFADIPRPARNASPGLTEASLAVPNIYSVLRPDDITPVNPPVQKELEEFLNMGHSSSCWCSRASPQSCPPSSPAVSTRPESHNGPTALRKEERDEMKMGSEAEVEALSISSGSSPFDSENLGSPGYDLLTPSGSEQEQEENVQEDDGWAFVAPNHGRSRSSSAPSALYSSTPGTPVPIPHTPSPVSLITDIMMGPWFSTSCSI